MGYRIRLTILLLVTVACSLEASAESDGAVVRNRERRGVKRFFKGVANWVLKLFGLGMEVASFAQGEMQAVQLSTSVEGIHAGLREMKTAVATLQTEMDKLFSEVFAQIALTAALTQYSSAIIRMDRHITYFMNLQDVPEVHRLNRTKVWVSQMILPFETAAQAVLLDIHNLVVGRSSALYNAPLLHLFHSTVRQDRNQSRLWKTQAYANTLMLRQATLYGLWLYAIHEQNASDIDYESGRIRQLVHTRLSEQWDTLEELRQRDNDYSLYALGGSLPEVRQFCARSALCLANGWGLAVRGGVSKVALNCSETEVETEREDDDDTTDLCELQPLHSRRVTVFRLFSTEMLKVQGDNQTICGLSIWEEREGIHVYVMLQADVCTVPEVRSPPVPHDVLTSSRKHLKRVHWPYRIAQAQFPLSPGLVTGIGLAAGSHKAIVIKMETEFSASHYINKLPSPTEFP